ncbi:ATP-dependent Clp protease ATP-binding subunit ClpX, partial [Striga asiatica]
MVITVFVFAYGVEPRSILRWRSELIENIAVNGILKLPNEMATFKDICVEANDRRLFLRFKTCDLYLIAFKRDVETNRWQEMKASEDDSVLITEPADRLTMRSSYNALRSVDDKRQLNTNLSAFEDSVMDLLNPQYTANKMARTILRMLLEFPESTRLTQVEAYVGSDVYGGLIKGASDMIFFLLCSISANNLGDSEDPLQLAAFGLPTSDETLITRASEAR